MKHFSFPIKTGLLAGTSVCLIMLTGFLTGLYRYPIARTLLYFSREIGIVEIIIIAFAIFYSNFYFRKQFNFKYSLLTSLFITVIIAITGALFLYTYINYIHPAYSSFILEYRLRSANNAGDIRFIKETNSRKFTPTQIMASGFLQLMFQGFLSYPLW